MLRRFAWFLPLGLVALGLAACNGKLSPWGVKNKAATTNVQAAAAAAADIGDRLYGEASSASGQKADQPHRRSWVTMDPIVLHDCRLSIIEKEDVPAQKDGVLLKVLVKEGDVVQADQVLAMLDDRQARDDLAIAESKATGSVFDHKASEATRDEALVRYRRQLKLDSTGATSAEDRDAARLLYIKYGYEAEGKSEAIKLAQRERDKAKTTLDMYQIRSAIPGVIKAVFRKPGEAVKSAPSYEPLFQIENLSKLRVEGLVGIQYLAHLRQALRENRLRIVIEPSEAESPQQTLIGHLQEITSVAVSKARGKDPLTALVVSASTDGTVRVWDRATRSEQRVLRHPGAVHAVACTPPAAEANWCLSGADDGIARVWDLDHPGDQPLQELTGGHRRAVTCVAFSPDGKLCATGGDDHEICLWDPAGGHLRYRFPAGHRAGITAVQFLPRSQLISAGRDNTLRLWTLGDKGARLETTIDRRSGEVVQLGASADGQRVLFDQGKALRLLSLPGGFTEGVLQNPGGATNFTTFALFSPDARLILTAGASEGRLQLWRAPTPTNRGSELRQLISPERAPATCAAFAPDGSFIVTGTRDRQVLVWPVPGKEEIERQLTAQLTFLDGSVDSSARQVRIWAELANPANRLVPGSTVTMALYTDK